MPHITGKRDGPNRRNEHYDIGSRKNIPRLQAVQEVKAEKHRDVHVVKINRRDYVRDNPDSSIRDNVNRGK